METFEAKLKNAIREGFIIARGETTSHAHRIFAAESNSEIEIAEDERGYYLKINSGSVILTHEEHEAQTLGTGLHYIGKQWEFSELDEYQKVVD